MQWKTSLLDTDYISSPFLQKKVEEQITHGAEFSKRQSARGICQLKYQDIIRKLCPLIPSNKRAFWIDLAQRMY